MKKFLLIFLLFAFSLAKGQLQTGFYYCIKNEYKPNPLGESKRYSVIYYTDDGGKTSKPFALCDEHKMLKAGILQDDKNPAVLKINFWGLTTPSKHCNNSGIINENILLDEKHYFFYEIQGQKKVGDVMKYISVPFQTTELGVTTIPFKYRFGKENERPNEASTQISGGLYLGRKFGRSRFYIDKTRNHTSLTYVLALFISPTVISLSPETTNKMVAEKTSELGLGYGAAALISYRDLNFGLLGGLDTPISGRSGYWIYKNKPWIGVGLGYKIAILNGGK